MKHILIVDNEAEHLRSLRLGLSVRGYVVYAVLDAQSALDMLKTQSEKKLSLIITDYDMPDMDGLTLLEKIRESGVNLPSILMTAYSGKDLLVKALRAGSNGFIEKPFTLDELMEEIARVEHAEHEKKHGQSARETFCEFVHKINNQLFVIKGNVEVKLSSIEDHDTESLRAGLAAIDKAADKIRELSHRVLQLAWS